MSKRSSLSPQSAEELIVVYDDSPVKNSAPPANRRSLEHCEKQYHYEPRAQTYSSYRLATHNSRPAQYNTNNNNNDSDKKPQSTANGFVRQRQRHQQGGITRTSSLSHLMIGPRVETAFVGQDAYTVYYGNARNNQRFVVLLTLVDSFLKCRRHIMYYTIE